jgi:hypothetical protein
MAGQVLAGPQRDGWVEVPRKRSHRSPAKGDGEPPGRGMTVMTWARRR